MKLEKKVKKKLEDLGIFLLSGFLIGIATYNFASAFSFPMVGFTAVSYTHLVVENVGDPDYKSKLKVMLGADNAPDIFFSWRCV